MKAILLAAGLGTRLRPLTDATPKCLVPICGKPLLEIWLEHLGQNGVTNALVNTHYLHQQVEEFARRWQGPPSLQLVHEPVLLGSLGTLAANYNFIRGEESVLVCNADNLTDIDIAAMQKFHQRHDGLLTMALFQPDELRNCGVAELDNEDRIVGFEEKPSQPKSQWANAGVYLMRTSLWPSIPDITPADIGHHLLPLCTRKMFGWKWAGLLKDIGTAQAYAEAHTLWSAARTVHA